jgi:hypothetical protein
VDQGAGIVSNEHAALMEAVAFADSPEMAARIMVAEGYIIVNADMLARVLSESPNDVVGPITPEFWQKQGQALFDALCSLRQEPPQEAAPPDSGPSSIRVQHD